MVLLIVITSLIFKKSFAWKLKLTLTKKGFKWRRYVPLLSRSGLFKLRSCSKLRSIDIPMYSVIWGGGAVFLRISKHKEGKTDSRTCISKRYVGLNLDYLFGVKSIFTFHNLPSLSFFVQFPRMRLVISSAMCWIQLLSESAGQPHCSRRVDVSEAMLYSIQKSMILVKNWFHPSKLKLNLLLPNINWWEFRPKKKNYLLVLIIDWWRLLDIS